MSNIASSSHTFWGADTNMSVRPQCGHARVLMRSIFSIPSCRKSDDGVDNIILSKSIRFPHKMSVGDEAGNVQ